MQLLFDQFPESHPTRLTPDQSIKFNPNTNTHDPSTMDSSELDCLGQQGFLSAYSYLSFAIP